MWLFCEQSGKKPDINHRIISELQFFVMLILIEIILHVFVRRRKHGWQMLLFCSLLVVIVKLFKGQFSSFSHSLGLVLNGCEVIQFSVRNIRFASKRESLMGFLSHLWKIE